MKTKYKGMEVRKATKKMFINRIESSLIAKNKEEESFWKKLRFETFRISLTKEINSKNMEK